MMNGRVARTGIAAVVMLAVLVSPATGAVVSFTPTAIATSAVVSESNPQTDGKWLVYQLKNFLVPGSFSSLILRDMQSGSNTTIGGGDTSNQWNPDVSLGRVAYSDDTAGNTDVRIYDRQLAVDYPVVSTSANETSPRISGNLVVWRNDSTGELWFRDLFQGLTAKVPGADNVTVFDVDNGQIVWGEAFVTEALYVWDPSLEHTPRVFYSVASGHDVDSVRIHHERVVVTLSEAGGSCVARLNVNLAESHETSLGRAKPDVFHDTMAWQYDVGSHDDLYWMQLSPTNSGTIGSGSYDEGSVSMFGRRIAFERKTAPLNTDLYVATAANEPARTQGADRYLTAVEASKAYFSASDWAILCTGADFPDALAAGPLARALNCPLLLTRPAAVPSNVMTELQRLGVKDVILVGGTSVVNESVKTQLQSAGMSVPYRLAGPDRYATSVEVATLMSEIYTGVYGIDLVFFARGDNFPDALALGPVAAGACSPIMLVRSSSVPPVVADAVDDMNVVNGVIAGGSAVVSEGVKSELSAIMAANGADPYPVERWSGPDRYATAVEIVEQGVANRWIDLDTVGIATGLNFPDALGGGAALGHYGSPVLLVRESIPASVNDWLMNNRYSIGRVDIFGGSDVVPDSVKSSLKSIMVQ